MDNLQYYAQWSSYFSKTTLNPLGIGALALLGAMILWSRRERIIIAFVLLVCFIPEAQRIVIGGMDFNFLRILLMVAWIRILRKNDFRPDFRMGKEDIWIIVFIVYSSLAYTMQYGSASAFFNRCGRAIDVLGLYFLLRQLLTGWDDVRRIIRLFCIVAPIVAAFFIVEKSTGRNPFSVFGGVPEFSQVREGKLRCQGAFSHPILAGCFWATLLPLMGGFAMTEAKRLVYIAGIGSSLLIIVLCASSTPILAIAFIFLGTAMFALRYKMKWLRFGIVLGYLGLDVAMKAPVYSLIGRFDVASGSTGYHRVFLIENTLKHWKEWVAFGTHHTAQWGHQMFDITNGFIAVAFDGGLLSLTFYVMTIGYAYSNVGKVVWSSFGDRNRTILAWSVGVSLFTHMMNFLAVSYFGYIEVLWILALAVPAILAECESSFAVERAGAPELAPA